MRLHVTPMHLRIPLLAVLLLNYLPWAFVAAAREYRFMLVVGLYLMLSLGLRHARLTERLPAWAKSLWLFADALVWLWGQRAANGENPFYGGLVLGADAAMIGWAYWRGAAHTLAMAAILLVGLRLDYPYPDFWTNLALSLLVGLLFVYGCVYLAAQARAESEAAAAARREAEAANRLLREHARQVEELSVLRERNRIAREVHDTIAHGFTGIIIHLDLVKHWLEVDPARALAAADLVQGKARESLAEVRRSVHALRPLQLEGLQGIDGLRRLVDDARATTGAEVELAVAGEVVELPVSHELCLYRAAQEGITNALRHGQATRVQITVAHQSDGVLLQVTDNGRGAGAVLTQGLGLTGIRERAGLLGGHVEAGPNPAGGFRLQVRLPIAGTAPRATEGASAS